MKFGLSDLIYKKIQNIIKKYPYQFKIFGSRARGDFKKTSDIDIAVFENVKPEDEYGIRNDFDKIDMEYMVDIVFVNSDTKEELLQSILKEGVDI